MKIGAILPLTGALSINGKDNQDAMNLYLEQSGGKLAGRTVQMVYADDAAQPDTGLTKARQLVESDKVALLMGLQSSQVCYA
ncbi:MAG: ABC transporter substrate-binding protein, partial [Chloroflexi bacterium]|nr:ABC transporter substrate-binding protein [Chloroflexota bacterium]